MRKVTFLFIQFVLPLALLGKEVKLSPKGGIFKKPLYVNMVTDSNTAIYYTIDGSIPNSQSLLYTDSILVKDVLVLRAITYINGKRSKVNTQSYFTGREFSLPIISVVSNPDNFWSYGKGIYEKGCCADSTMPYYGANFWKSWEYECNIEMYTPTGKRCFNQLAGMSLFGGYSRMLPQKSLAIIARSKYGKKRFDYRIFKERKTKKYKSFIIRNSGGDFKRTHLRDAFMTQLAKPTGVAIQAYEPAIVFLNGKYWGIQNLREKISEHYLKDNFQVDKDKVDILRHNGVKRHGFSKNYKFLRAFLRSNDLTDHFIADSLSKFMNIHDYIRYNISEVYSDNKDAGGNIRYFRERKPKAKWRWIFYDLDMGLSNDDKTGYASNTLKKFTTASNEVWPNPAWSTFIIRTILKNKKIEHQYINTFCDYLNTCFHSDTALALFNKMAKRIEPEIPYHQKRWGATVENWKKNLDIVRKFVQKRPEHLYKHIDEKFGLDTLIEVSVKLPSEDLCNIKLNSIDIKADFKGQYFTQIPQKIKANPKHDYELIGWKGRSETTEKITFLPSSNVYFEPIIKPKDSSRHQHQIIINEVSFNQVDLDSTGDWIELYNMGVDEVNVAGWVITDKTYKKGIKIEEGTIQPDSYMLICRQKQNLIRVFDLEVSKMIDSLNFGLSKKGEFIKLYDYEGRVVDYMTYDTSYSQIDSAFTIALVIPDSAHNSTDNWMVQNPSPLMPNPSYTEAVARWKADEADRNKWQMIYAISGGVVVLLLFAVIVLRRRKKKRKNEASSVD
ncbi:MAG: CotH kinase family protein [Crocinitomicaceae bacterium]